MLNPVIGFAIMCGVIYIVGRYAEYRTTHANYQPRIERQFPEPPGGTFLYGWRPNEGLRPR